MSKMTITDASVMLPGFLDVSNPRALVNIAPFQIRSQIAALDPKKLELSDKMLNKEAEPDLTDKCLRINFWTEYVRAQDKNNDMLLGNVIRGVTTREYIMHIATENQAKLAYMIIPPKDYNIVQESIFRDSLEKLKNLIALPPYDIVEKTLINEKGETRTVTKRLNPAYIAEVRKVATMLADRLQGSVTKKVDITGNLQVGQQAPAGLITAQELQTIEAELLNG